MEWRGGTFFCDGKKGRGTSFIDTSFPLQTARPSRCWNNHVKWQSRLQYET